MGALKAVGRGIARAARKLYSLVHGYDDIRGSRRESPYPLDPTPAELEAARRITGEQPPPTA